MHSYPKDVDESVVAQHCEPAEPGLAARRCRARREHRAHGLNTIAAQGGQRRARGGGAVISVKTGRHTPVISVSAGGSVISARTVQPEKAHGLISVRVSYLSHPHEMVQAWVESKLGVVCVGTGQGLGVLAAVCRPSQGPAEAVIKPNPAAAVTMGFGSYTHRPTSRAPQDMRDGTLSGAGGHGLCHAGASRVAAAL